MLALICGGVVDIDNCLRMMEEKLAQLEILPLNVAVVGNVATGKSSFINSIRTLGSADENAAPVGEFQSTLDIREYPHPRIPELKFWDLPGVGSMQFPRETYLRDVSIDRFDFFILVTAGRLTETDEWLGQEIRKCEKKYFFVRTNIDKDISNDRKAHPNSHNEEALINNIRKYTAAKLKTHGHSDVPVFLISNYERTQYDFHPLEQQLVEEIPAIRKNAVTLYKCSATRDMIKAAIQGLYWRLWIYSLLSAAAASVDIYLLSTGLFAIFSVHWSHVCFNQFGLGDVAIERYARIMSVNPGTLKEIVWKNFGERRKKRKRSAGVLIGILSIPAFRLLIGLALKQYPPFLIRIISATASLVSTRLFLGHILKVKKQVAVMVADFSVSKIRDEPES